MKNISGLSSMFMSYDVVVLLVVIVVPVVVHSTVQCEYESRGMCLHLCAFRSAHTRMFYFLLFTFLIFWEYVDMKFLRCSLPLSIVSVELLRSHSSSLKSFPTERDVDCHPLLCVCVCVGASEHGEKYTTLTGYFLLMSHACVRTTHHQTVCVVIICYAFDAIYDAEHEQTRNSLFIIELLGVVVSLNDDENTSTICCMQREIWSTGRCKENEMFHVVRRCAGAMHDRHVFQFIVRKIEMLRQ